LIRNRDDVSEGGKGEERDQEVEGSGIILAMGPVGAWTRGRVPMLRGKILHAMDEE
jgi:hypothetical protein